MTSTLHVAQGLCQVHQRSLVMPHTSSLVKSSMCKMLQGCEVREKTEYNHDLMYSAGCVQNSMYPLEIYVLLLQDCTHGQIAVDIHARSRRNNNFIHACPIKLKGCGALLIIWKPPDHDGSGNSSCSSLTFGLRAQRITLSCKLESNRTGA